jgi:hypothetical protein
MATVKIGNDVLDDLVGFKLKYIVQEMQRILEQWNYRSIDLFLAQAKDGTLKGAEMDAIALRQLMINREKLEKLRQN